MKHINKLTTEQINELMFKTSLDKEALERLFDEKALRIFDGFDELFDWLNRGVSTWEDYLDQSIESLMDSLYDYREDSNALDSMMYQRVFEDPNIHVLGGDKLFIYML